MRESITKTVCIIVFFVLQLGANAQKRIYLSNDDHTDYMWTADSATYQNAFLNMLDSWLTINENTSGNASPFQTKWSCDGSFWIKVYKKYRTETQYNRLIDQIRNGKITVPYSSLVLTYGGIPAEGILRTMYYAGQLERDHGLDFSMAIAMENQTLPLGLASLWKGSGAKYCWHGVCDCQTQITGLGNRQREIYWYKGLDTNKILLKWYNIANPGVNNFIGGYAEAMLTQPAIDALTSKTTSNPAYPYDIAAGFGVGHDAIETITDQLVPAAMANSNAARQIIVSNEVDFFEDFENSYGGTLDQVTQTFGNEWDHACASISEVSAKIKRSLEKLRAAEAMAAIVINYQSTFASTLDSLKKEAWMALGLYWEHSLGFEQAVPFSGRYAFQVRLENTFSSYVDQLYTLAQSNLGNLITNGTSNVRFYAFNPLGWQRTDYADYAYPVGSTAIKILDVNLGTEVPFQFITKDGIRHIRVEAANIPSIGYKVFEIQNGTAATFSDAANVDLGNNIFENNYFRIVYTNEGVLTSILDKINNKEIVAQTNGKFVNDLGTGATNNGSIVMVNNAGPVSVTILTTTGTAPLAHNTRITLFKNIPRIDIDNQITQNFDAINSWSYSFNITSPEVWHEETGAVIKAKLTSNGGHYATQNARYDWNTINHFASVNESNANYGVSLSNQDCYFMKIGNSDVHNLDETVNSRQLNILAGGRIDNYGFPNQEGESLFNQRFAITTHTVYSAAEDMKRALEHQNSLVCGTVVSPVNFLLPNQFSFVSTTEPNALIWALKPSEEGADRGIVTRIWNLGNTDIALNPNINYGLPIALAKRTTHVETDMNDAIYLGRDLFTAIGHNEMRTYRVKLNVIALPVKLLSFEGDKIEDINALKWKATSELDLKTYELQRSIDGQQFYKLTSLPIKTGTTNSYNYNDSNINVATPYYYRLKMLNINNTFSYSNTVLIKAAKEASNIILFPNPVKDILKANFIISKKTRGQIAIYNTKGEMVKTVAPPLFERGNNYYILPVKELPAGAYIFSVTAADKKYVKAFIKE